MLLVPEILIKSATAYCENIKGKAIRVSEPSSKNIFSEKSVYSFVPFPKKSLKQKISLNKIVRYILR